MRFTRILRFDKVLGLNFPSSRFTPSVKHNKVHNDRLNALSHTLFMGFGTILGYGIGSNKKD